MDRRTELRVKIRYLAEEARIIRHEERKALANGRRRRNKGEECPHDYRQHRILQSHRQLVVRPEARHSQLAYAFLRGKPYAEVEDRVKNPPDWTMVVKLAIRFGSSPHSASDESQARVTQEVKDWAAATKPALRAG